MASVVECNGPLIPPIHSQGSPNQSIGLGDVAVQFAHQGKTYQNVAKVAIQFLPRKELLFTFPTFEKEEFKAAHNLITEGGRTELILLDRGVSIEAYCHAVGEDGVVFTPVRPRVAVTPRSERLATMVFHLFNFAQFHRGPHDYAMISKGVRICGRSVLKAGGWNITIAATDKTHDVAAALQQNGGYVITHMGKIEREDGSQFSTEQAEPLLFCVEQFLSFALGRRAGIALPVGFDAEGCRVFEQWDVPNVARDGWRGSFSWFDERHGGLLSEVFPGFFARWNDGTWKEHLRIALFWYLSANEGSGGINVDAGTILAQTALERLAWAYCVKDRRMVSQKAFEPRGLSAADKIRMLASTLGIPTTLPQSMASLNRKCKNKWADIPEAITSVRNALVHPSKKDSPPRGSYYEAWRVSMWLLDLVLLRLCRHTGEYVNRLADGSCVGMVEQVPWTTPRAVGAEIE